MSRHLESLRTVSRELDEKRKESHFRGALNSFAGSLLIGQSFIQSSSELNSSPSAISVIATGIGALNIGFATGYFSQASHYSRLQTNIQLEIIRGQDRELTPGE